MALLGKDDLHEASAAVNLHDHSPSGSGATGGAWSVLTSNSDFVSLAANAGFTGQASLSTLAHQGSSPSSIGGIVQCVIDWVVETYAGVMLVSNIDGHVYAFIRNVANGRWELLKYTSPSSNSLLAFYSNSFSTLTDFTIRLKREISGSSVILTPAIDGVDLTPYTDSSSAYTGDCTGGIFGFNANSVVYKNYQFDSVASGGITPTKGLIFDGNSLDVGYPGVGSSSGLYPGVNPLVANQDTSYPAQIMRYLPGDVQAYNFAYSARPLDSTAGDSNSTGHTQNGDFATNLAPIISAWRSGGVQNIVVVMGMEPGNMIYLSNLNGGTGGFDVQVAAINAVKKYSNLVHEAGAKLVLVVPPYRGATSASNSAFLADLEAVRGWLRQYWPRYASALADPNFDVRFSSNADSAIYTDQTHFTTTGQATIAPLIAGSIMQAFGLAPIFGTSPYLSRAQSRRR